jgi:RimJ/RimL family protein N-acetyltransferase
MPGTSNSDQSSGTGLVPVAGDLDLFCAYRPDGAAVRARLDKAIAAGSVRPEWCFTLGDAADRAAVAYWAPYRGADPVVSYLLDPGPDPARGAELLRSTLPTLHTDTIMHDIPLETGERPESARPAVHTALAGAGYRMEVERLQLAWPAQRPEPVDSGRLTYRPARDLPAGELVALLGDIAIGSLDHDTRVEIAAGRAEQDAQHAYDYLTSVTSQTAWFEIGYAGTEPVGLVAPAADSAMAYIAYIGVRPAHRGRGYVDDLLARGTRTLATAGVDQVVAGTDAGNTPMAAAFSRAGYVELGRLFRYYWRAPG